MAASMVKFLCSWTPRVCSVRWTRYNPYYLEPEACKDVYSIPESELSAEQRERRELKTLRPIKASKSTETSSQFNHDMISKFVNMMMQDGNKVLAREIMTQALESMKRRQVEKYHRAPAAERAEIECNPYAIFHQAIHNCKPIIGLASVQRGGRNYQVPVPLTDKRRRFLAMKWMISECRDNKHRRTHMYEKLSQELLAAFANDGNVVKRKHDLHKMAEANRAYAHYRWW